MAHYQSIISLHSALLPEDRQAETHKHQFVMGMQAAAVGVLSWFHVTHRTGPSDPLLVGFISRD